MTDLRIVVAEDHYLVREGIRQTLETVAGIVVVATVGSAPDLEAAVDDHLPDVLVTDIRMPPGDHSDGIDAALRIRNRHPGIGIVVLSQYAEAEYALELLGDGSSGVAYLLKERIGDPDQLAAAVRAVARGDSTIDPTVVAALVDHNNRRGSSNLRFLTEREIDVLSKMAEGYTNASIAAELHLSESSIEKYSTTIFAKLGLSDQPGVHRRVAAVLTFLHESSRAEPI
jgi:DNA-binding NarL/FixJ family response regulator